MKVIPVELFNSFNAQVSRLNYVHLDRFLSRKLPWDEFLKTSERLERKAVDYSAICSPSYSEFARTCEVLVPQKLKTIPLEDQHFILALNHGLSPRYCLIITEGKEIQSHAFVVDYSWREGKNWSIDRFFDYRKIVGL